MKILTLFLTDVFSVIGQMKILSKAIMSELTAMTILILMTMLSMERMISLISFLLSWIFNNSLKLGELR